MISMISFILDLIQNFSETIHRYIDLSLDIIIQLYIKINMNNKFWLFMNKIIKILENNNDMSEL